MIDPSHPDYTNTPVNPRRPKYVYQSADSLSSPVVSIITPYFNTGELFKDTIQSVLGQSLQRWEWIIVNDGTTDPEALEVLDSVRHLDQRIKVVDQSNKGLPAARNAALRKALAPLLFFLDSDDMIEPTTLEKLYWMMISDQRVSFVTSWVVGFGQETYLWSCGFEAGNAFLAENMVTVSSLVRRELIEAVGEFDEARRQGLEDYEFWLRCAANGYWGHDLREYLIWIRKKGRNYGWDVRDDRRKYNRFISEMRSLYPNLYSRGIPSLAEEDLVGTAFQTIPQELPFDHRLHKPCGKKRLLLLLPRLAMGGADKFNLDLVEQLSKRGYEITICTTMEYENPWLPQFARFTPDIFILHHFLRLADYPRFLHYLIQSRQIDVVLISNSPLGYQLLPYLRSRCPGVTFADYNHIEVEWKNGGHARSGVGYQELLDLNIVSTHHLKDWMVTRGADGSRVEVCHTNIDPERWDPARYSRSEIRRSLVVPETVPLILYAGRLCDQKRPQLFAEVMLELARQKLEFLCLVAGDGEARRFLEIFIWRHRLGRRVRLLGAVSSERMHELMAAADVFFLPSQWEGIALTLFEAMAMQVVPVAADVGGQRELVTSECGFLIPQGQNEVQEYISVLKQLIESPDLRASMGQAGRRRIVEHFTIGRMAERMVELLNRAQELSKVSPRPAVGTGLGLECATLAIEYTRLEQFADRHWTRYYLPVKLAQLFKIDMSAAKRMYWVLSAMPGVKQAKSLVGRLLGWLH